MIKKCKQKRSEYVSVCMTSTHIECNANGPYHLQVWEILLFPKNSLDNLLCGEHRGIMSISVSFYF